MEKKRWGRFLLALLIVVVAAGGVYLYFYQRYSVSLESVKGWHTSLPTALQEATKRDVPVLVKVGHSL